MRSINPATGELIRDYPEHSEAEARRMLDRAGTAFRDWRDALLEARGERLLAVAAVLRAQLHELASLLTAEMGKPIGAAEAEIEKCARACEWFAAEAAGYLAPRVVASDAKRSTVRCEPLGVVLAIMPWNFPFWQLFRCAAPALMAGNVVALKHASSVPGASLAIERVFREGGLPDGVVTSLLVPARAVAALIAHPAVRAVSLTGSEAAGMEVAALAGAALKKSVLELGGSDPFIVLADADPEAVALEAAAARIVNNGESCIAAKRFIVVDAVAERFLDLFAAQLSSRRMGDPMDRGTHIGPQARVELRDSLHQQVEESVKHGARLLLGGEVPRGPGAFYPPTLLVGVDKGMPAFDEETFGPVAAVVRAKDESDAVRVANDSVFGLGASLWTQDRARGKELAAQIEAGAVFVNGIVKSDPRLPFGGIKRSGYGRELSEYGIREFVNIKSVWIG